MRCGQCRAVEFLARYLITICGAFAAMRSAVAIMNTAVFDCAKIRGPAAQWRRWLDEQSKDKEIYVEKQYPKETLPLHAAAQNNDVSTIKVLLAEDADPNERNEGGYTPLHIAARSGAVDAVAFLIEATDDINAQGKDGDTPIYYAALSGVLEAVKLLLDAGADPRIANERGETPSSIAQDHGYTEIVELIG